MNSHGVVVMFACVLGGLLAVGGAFTFQAGQRQASLALFVTAGCVLVASLVTSVIVIRADAVQAKARADYATRYEQ